MDEVAHRGDHAPVPELALLREGQGAEDEHAQEGDEVDVLRQRRRERLDAHDDGLVGDVVAHQRQVRPVVEVVRVVVRVAVRVDQEHRRRVQPVRLRQGGARAVRLLAAQLEHPLPGARQLEQLGNHLLRVRVQRRHHRRRTYRMRMMIMHHIIIIIMMIIIMMI